MMKKFIAIVLACLPLMMFANDTLYVEKPGTYAEESRKDGRFGAILVKGNLNVDDLIYMKKASFFWYAGAGYCWVDLSCTTLVEQNIPAQFYQDTFVRIYKLPKNTKKISFALFRNCRYLEQIAIPEGVEEIATYAFTDTALEEVVLPSTVKNISKDAFSNIKSLRRIYCKSTTVPKMYDTTGDSKKEHIFSGCDVDAITLYVPQGCAEAYRNSESFGMFSNIVEVKEGEWTLGLSTVEKNENIFVTTTADGLMIDNTQGDVLHDVQVIRLDGNVVWKGDVAQQIKINLPSGLYIVKHGRWSKKIAIAR